MEVPQFVYSREDVTMKRDKLPATETVKQMYLQEQ